MWVYNGQYMYIMCERSNDRLPMLSWHKVLVKEFADGEIF